VTRAGGVPPPDTLDSHPYLAHAFVMINSLIADLVVAALTAGYLFATLLLVGHALLQLWLLTLARRARPSSAPATALPDPLPRVTVQLPVYNERFVVERLLEHVTALRYPTELLCIQVLDDSTDDTSGLIADWLRRRSGNGLRIAQVRRGSRAGFKAGALAQGLQRAPDGLVAVFDADFMPPPDFLERALPYFADPRTAAVQGRWTYANRTESALTRVLGIFMDAHFLVEQPGRTELGGFVNFNGSGGIWRTASIRRAGGWTADTLTEDLDLSYRTQLGGDRIVFDADLQVPGEIPGELSAVRVQQHRWMKGVAQNARRLLGPVLRAPVSWRIRVHACAHLLASGLYLAIAAVVVLSVPVGALAAHGDIPRWIALNPGLAATFLLLAPIYHEVYRREVSASRLGFFATYVGFLMLSMSLAIHNGLAALLGYFGHRSEFVRTPKRGDATGSASWRRSGYRSGIRPIIVIELLVWLACVSAVARAALSGDVLLVWPTAAFTIAYAMALAVLVRERWPARRFDRSGKAG
jgi:cellulose synthase/poly-beta-1,6-N-acetylglucosamine synthase-like glycosyltransferase